MSFYYIIILDMTLNIITNLLCICLFFGLSQQIYGINPKHFDEEGNSEFFDSIDHFEENNDNEGIVEQNNADETLNNPKNQSESLNEPDEHSDQNHSYENDKAKVPDDCMECLICCDYATNDQLCFCDDLIGSNSKEAGKDLHAFCRECLQGYTKAALETKPFARGWLGLKCMAEKCENTIPWQKIKKDASPDQLKAIEILENHCDELSVSEAGVCIERCPKCNYAIDMDGPLRVATNDTKNSLLKLFKSKQKLIDPYAKLKFHCSECHYEMCRKCNEKWAEEHNNLTCKQLAKQQNKRNFRDNHLSAKFVKKFRNCPNCKIPFEKIAGCNHMTCRCCKFQFWYCCGAKYNQKHTSLCRISSKISQYYIYCNCCGKF